MTRALLITLLLLVPPYLFAAGPSYQRSGFQISAVQIDPETPEVGDNELRFRLSSAKDSKPLGPEATVEVEVFMPEMGTMPRMSMTATAELQEDGSYLAELEISMAGSWEVPVRIKKQGKTVAEFPFSVTIGSKGLLYKGPKDKAESTDPTGPNVYLSNKRQQLIGVELGKAERRHVYKRLLTVARIELDESRVFDITLKYTGKVERLFANREGQFIRKGQPLFSVYSPALFEAQQIFLQLDKLPRRTGSDKVLYRSAKEKLLLWDFTEADLKALRAKQHPPRAQVIISPFSGYIVKKSLNEGRFAKKGESLFQIADLSKLWAMAEVFEYEAGEVKQGDPVTLSLAYQAGVNVEGMVNYLYPYLDPRTRTLKLRIEVDNLSLMLKPGMYADVEIRSDQGERLMLPRRAILFSGRHKYVFTTKGKGYFSPVEVTTGQTDGEWVEILTGLEAGTQVSFSANFLISSEAQLRGALPRFGEPEEVAQ